MTAPLRGSPLRFSKLAVLLLWAWGLLSFFLDPALGGWVTAGRWAASGLVLAHAVELLLYLPKLVRAGEKVGAHIVPLMIFGGVHFFSLQLEAPEARES